MIKYVSYHNNRPLYVACGRQLAASLDAVGVKDYHIERFDNDDWTFAVACAMKPWFLWGCMQTFKDYDRIVYLDSDSVVMQYPGLFEEIPDDFDIGVHYKDETELLGSVIYFRNTPKVSALILEWSENCHKDLKTWDQKILQEMLDRRLDIGVYGLPPTYCQIFDLMAGCGGPPVIKQMQASRKSRGTKPDHNPIVVQ